MVGGRLLCVVLLALLAGCTGLDVAPAPERAPAFASEATAARALPVFADEAPRRLPATLALSEQWLRPTQNLTANLSAPGASHVAWFVAIDGMTPRLHMVGDRPHVFVDFSAGAPHLPATGDLAPGGAPVGLAFAIEGRHLLQSRHHPDARLVVNVAQDGGATAQAFLTDVGGHRFVPDEVTVRPGGRVWVRNQAASVGDATGKEFLLRLPGAGPSLEMNAVDEGLYTLVAAVRAPDGTRGEARARFVVDFERPSDRLEVGPVTYRFDVVPATDDTVRVPFHADLPIRHGHVRTRVHSPLPGDASVHVELRRGGQIIAAWDATEGMEQDVGALPAGDYALYVSPREGTLVEFQLDAFFRLRLPTPPELDEARAPGR